MRLHLREFKLLLLDLSSFFTPTRILTPHLLHLYFTHHSLSLSSNPRFSSGSKLGNKTDLELVNLHPYSSATLHPHPIHLPPMDEADVNKWHALKKNKAKNANEDLFILHNEATFHKIKKYHSTAWRKINERLWQSIECISTKNKEKKKWKHSIEKFMLKNARFQPWEFWSTPSMTWMVTIYEQLN